MLEEKPDIGFLYPGTLAEAVNYGVAIAILFAGAAAVAFFFLGGIQFITSSGDEEKTKKAVTTIRYSVVGLLIVIFAVTAVSLIGAIFDMDIMEPLQWNTIIDSLQEISDRLARRGSFSGDGETLQ